MIGMAKKPRKKARAALAVLLCILLVGAAVALGSLWALYRAYPYPSDYRAEIEKNAALYGQDPLLVAAVIRTESGWGPGVVSSVGATGLMQVMPGTGKWIASQQGWEYADSMLSEPAYNIQLGCWYLNRLSGKFGGDRTLLLAAYNAGDNKVQQWVSEGRVHDGQLDIPYAETRSFVRKVMDSYEKYKLLYKNK
jgi:soluble lytic murein transglycosylase